MRRTRTLVAVAVVAAGCSGSAKQDVVPTTITTPSPATRAQVVDITVSSLPESPVLNRSGVRSYWAKIVARLPERLPAPIPQEQCETGPVLIVALRDGSEITYQCKLPPEIGTVRDYMVSIVSRSASPFPNPN
jgi:hypothetical protein